MTKEQLAILESVVNQLTGLIQSLNPYEEPEEKYGVVGKDTMDGVSMSLDDLRAKADEAMRYCSIDDVGNLVRSYGVTGISGIKPKQYSEVHDKLEAMIEASEKSATDASDD